MSSVMEKVAYIKGLMEGLKLDESKPEGKILSAVVNVLGEISSDISELFDQTDAIEEDLSLLVNDCYLGYDDEDDDDDFYCEVTCPNCNETVCLPEFVLMDGDAKCPNCNEVLDVDISKLEPHHCTPTCECGPNCECK